MRQPRRFCRRRGRRWNAASSIGPIPARRTPRAAQARALMEARATIADVLDWRHDVIFTSGASEAIEIAATRARIAGPGSWRDRACHRAACDGRRAQRSFRSRPDGLIDERRWTKSWLQGPRWSRSSRSITRPASSSRSTGSRRRSARRGRCCLRLRPERQQIPLPDADFIALSAHKLGGPPGIGALLVKDLATLEPVGGQEKGYRRGTQDAPSAGLRRGAGRRPYDMDRALRRFAPARRGRRRSRRRGHWR